MPRAVTHFTRTTTPGSQRLQARWPILVAPGGRPARSRASCRGWYRHYSGERMSILKLAKVPALLAATALTAIAPGKAEAQGGVNLVPWAGVYIPTRNSISDLDNALSRDVSVIGGAPPPLSG